MTSPDTQTAHAASAPVDAANAKPSETAKAAVDGTPLPADKLEDLADKLTVEDASTHSDSNAGPASLQATDGSGSEVAEKKKKKSSSSKSKDTKSSKGPALQNLSTFDAFADADELETQNALEKSTKAPEYIHIRIQQRNGRKTLTTVQGVPDDYDPKKLLKHFKKEFACNGTIVEDEELGQVIQLQGDQRAKISQMLTEDVGLGKETIKIHGF